MSTAAPFSLDPSLRILSTAALLKRYKRLSPAERQTLGFTRPATDAEIAGSARPPGAPADFGGPVFQNPDGVKVSDDTESGIEPLRLPTGVSLQHQNFTGPTPADVSNPPQTEITGPHVQTVQAKFGNAIDYDALAQKHGAEPSGAVDYDALAAKHGAEAPNNEPPADYLTRTEDRIDEVAKTAARGTGSLVSAIAGALDPRTYWHMLTDAPTEEEQPIMAAAQNMNPRVALFVSRLAGVGQIKEAGEFYHRYLKAPPEEKRRMEEEMLSVAPEAIGAGAAAALLPKLIEKAPGAVSAVSESLPSNTKITAPVRAIVKGTNTVLKKAPGSVGASVGAATGGYFAGHLGAEIGGGAGALLGKELLPTIKLPGENLGLPKTVEGGPANAPAFQEAPAAAPPAETTPAAATPETGTPHGGGIPRTLSGESALRQILTGQDNANLIKIAKSRGINITQESQLKPGVADSKLINKIIDHFSDDELDGVRSQYLENNRMGKHNFGDIGPEAWKTMGMQSYFPDVKIADAALRRTQTAIAAAEEAKTAPDPTAKSGAELDLTELLQKSVDQAKQKGARRRSVARTTD